MAFVLQFAPDYHSIVIAAADPHQREPRARAVGPRTAEGKATSSRNATKHGLTARDVVIFGEDPAAFEQFRDGFVTRFEPADEVEGFLVDRVAAAAWRLRRAVRIERGIFEDYESLKNRPHVSVPPSASHAIMVDAGGLGAFAQLARHEAAIERGMLRALHELERLQASRTGREVPVPTAMDVSVTAAFTQ